jgi:hypothetical protein
VEDSLFKNMCISIYRFIGCNKENPKFSENEFLMVLNKLNRKRMTIIKKEMADKKREEILKSINGEIVNIMADSGTFGGKTRLICKLAHGIEKFTNQEIPFLQKLNPISKRIKNYSTSKFMNKYNVEYFNEDIEWATPVTVLYDPIQYELAVQHSKHNSSLIKTSERYLQTSSFGKKNNPPILFKSFLNVRTADDYLQSFLECINFARQYNAIVGSFTVDYLPVQQKVLSKNGLLSEFLKKLDVENVQNFPDTTIITETSKNTFKEEMKTNFSATKSFDINSLGSEMLLTPPNSTSSFEYEFHTPLSNIINFCEQEHDSKIMIPICYGCNCHCTHLCFLHVVKKEKISHNFIGNFRNIVKHLSYSPIRNILGGKMPLYYNTRWLALFNGLTFIKKKIKELQLLFPNEKLDLLDGVFHFRTAIYGLIDYIRYNEKDTSNIINCFPIASQLILMLRLCQNYFQHSCKSLIPFLADISMEIFKNIFINEKAGLNMIAFLLSPHGRDAFYKGFFQWGHPYSSPFFNDYDVLFTGDAEEYYSFGDDQKNSTVKKWIKDNIHEEPSKETELHPYLHYILKFIQSTSKYKKEFITSSNSSANNSNNIENSFLNPILNSFYQFPSFNNVSDSFIKFNPNFTPFNQFPSFNSLPISSRSINSTNIFSQNNKEKSVVLKNHKLKLLQILNTNLTELRWEPIDSNDKPPYSLQIPKNKTKNYLQTKKTTFKIHKLLKHKKINRRINYIPRIF